jgi:hypothetical protein
MQVRSLWSRRVLVGEQEAAYEKANQSWGRVSGERDTALRARDEAQAVLDEPAATDAQAHFPALEQRLANARLTCRTAQECAQAESRLREEMTAHKNRWAKEQTRLAQSIASRGAPSAATTPPRPTSSTPPPPATATCTSGSSPTTCRASRTCSAPD